MSHSLSLNPVNQGKFQSTAKQPKKSLSYFLGLGLGKAVVSTRHKLSGVSKAIHHSIENDVEQRLAEQAEFLDMQYQQQEIAYCEEIERIKRRNLKVTISMTLIALLIGVVSGCILFWHYFF